MHVRFATHRPHPHRMAEGGGQVPSVALDPLFLERQEQFSADAEEDSAQIAGEVKRLNESSTIEAPVTPPSFAGQAVLRREEKSATAEAKRSSIELQARGKA